MKKLAVVLIVILVGICCPKLHAQGDNPNALSQVIPYATNISVTSTSTLLLTNNNKRVWVHCTVVGTNAVTICYPTNSTCVTLIGDYLPGSGGYMNLSQDTDNWRGNIYGITGSATQTSTVSIVEGRRQ